MAFDAYVVYVAAAPHTVRGFGMTQAQADARAAEDAEWSAYQGQVSDIPDGADGGGDWQFNTATNRVHRVGQSAADVIGERRTILKSLLREKEKIPGLAAWASGELNAADDIGRRAKSYSRWVEMMTRASAVDLNLSTNSSYAILLAEASIDGRTWYWLHWIESDGPSADADNAMPWDGLPAFANDDRATWAFYITHNNGIATPNSRGGDAAGVVLMGALVPTGFNWLAYLAA